MQIIESHKTVIFCIPERADPVESAWVSEMKEETKMLVFTACNMKQSSNKEENQYLMYWYIQFIVGGMMVQAYICCTN